ncbi:MAG: RidA family protein [Gemmatimonadaceae bacterium]
MTEHEGSAKVLSPRGWPVPRGYSNGVVASGRVVALAGQIGWNPATAAFETDDFVAQVRQALENVAILLSEAGAEPQHLVRLTWFITDRDAYRVAQREIGLAYRELMGRHFPPMSVVVVTALIEERARVEIEATAVLPQ